METEINYLCEAFSKVFILPIDKSNGSLNKIPDNAKLLEIPEPQNIKLRELILNNFRLIIGRFCVEFIRSPHRFKYITQFKWNLFQLTGFIQKADRLGRSLEPESVYYTYWCNEWASILTIAKQKGLQGKFITRMHGYDFDEQQNGRGYFPFRAVELPMFNKVYQVSEYGFNYVIDQYPGSKNLTVSRLGVNDLGMNPINSEKGKFILVSCSNFVALKRVNLIVDILKHLSIPYLWLHFGDGEGREKTENYARKQLSKSNFEFRGFVANSELMDFYKNNPVDLFINVSELEGLPVSLMEAISFGIPVVGCDICGVPEIVNSETGLLLDKNFMPEIAAHRIEEFVTSRSGNASFRNNVKEYYRQNFNAEHNYRSFAKKLMD